MTKFAPIYPVGDVRRVMLTTFLVLVTAVIAFSQTKPSDGGTSATTGRPSPTTSVTNPCASEKQLEILTDTRGVDFGPYLGKVVKIVQQNWYSLMPPSVYPPIKKQGKVAIEFFIRQDGTVEKMKIDTPSGDVQLDRPAWGSITASSPLPPLPKEFPGQNIGLRFYYFYNLTPDTTHLYITPCIDVRVPVGSTLQFSVPIGGIEQAAVKWSLSGLACEKGPCGTISENGLYTAPTSVPDPPTVFVRATPLSNRGIPAQTRLTVVEMTP